MSTRQHDRLALVTGASGGIGEAFAHELAAAGYALVLTARQEQELNRVRGVIAAKHQVPVTVIAMDLGDAGACDRLASELAARNLVPDLVVNNAGFGLVGPAAALPAADQLAMIDLNVRALTDLSLRFLPAMLARKSGGIVNVASTGAFMPGPNMAVYYATKNYVLAFSDALHEELKGIRRHRDDCLPRSGRNRLPASRRHRQYQGHGGWRHQALGCGASGDGRLPARRAHGHSRRHEQAHRLFHARRPPPHDPAADQAGHGPRQRRLVRSAERSSRYERL